MPASPHDSAPMPDTFHRLFALPGETDRGDTLPRYDAAGNVRTLQIVLHDSRHWPEIAALLAGLAQLDLPLPAVSVEAEGGYALWFALADPVPAERAGHFLHALRRRFLAEIPVDRIELLPGNAATPTLRRLPRQVGERWSAFIDPTLGSLFADGDGLDFPPDPERQAGLLAAVDLISSEKFERALNRLGQPVSPIADPAVSTGDLLPTGGDYRDPKTFLFAVMNDPRAAAAHRLAAASALLPYCHKPAGD